MSYESKKRPYIMVPKLDGNSKIGAQMCRYLGYLICLRHLSGSKSGTNPMFFRKGLFSIIRAQHVLSYHLLIAS